MADSLFTSVYFATQSQTVSVARCVLPSVAAFTLVLRYNAGLTRGEMGSQLVVFTMFQPIISGVTSQYRPRDYANVGTSVVLLFGPGDVLIVTGTLFSPSIALSVPVTALQGRGLGVTYDCGPVTLLSSSTLISVLPPFNASDAAAPTGGSECMSKSTRTASFFQSSIGPDVQRAQRPSVDQLARV